jgi:hypothetical protein
MARPHPAPAPRPDPLPAPPAAGPGPLFTALCGLVGPLAMAVALASCGGGGGRRGDPGNPSGGRSASSTSGPPTTPAPSSRPLPPAGSVAFTATGVPLSDPGLRVLVRPSGGVLRVVVRGITGGSNTVRICPVDGVSGTPSEGRCVVASDGRPVDLVVDEAAGGGVGGVLLRPPEGSSGAGIRVSEVTLIYAPDGDSITLVTPPLAPSNAAGECPGGTCAMGFELSPTGPGTFSLQADGRGARPQLTLRDGPAEGSGTGGSTSRVMSLVEGGSRLSIRSTVDGRTDASLVLRNVGDSELPALEIALVWPSRR